MKKNLLLKSKIRKVEINENQLTLSYRKVLKDICDLLQIEYPDLKFVSRIDYNREIKKANLGGLTFSSQANPFSNKCLILLLEPVKSIESLITFVHEIRHVYQFDNSLEKSKYFIKPKDADLNEDEIDADAFALAYYFSVDSFGLPLPIISKMFFSANSKEGQNKRIKKAEELYELYFSK